MTTLVSLQSLAEVLTQHPTLSHEGIAASYGQHQVTESFVRTLSADRADLLAREEQVVEIATWLLGAIAPIKTPKINSYYMKHVVEKEIGRYVSNGELIAAALVAGYPHKYDRNRRNPDLAFGMSLKDVKRVSA